MAVDLTAKVAVNVGVYHLDKLYSYAIPYESRKSFLPGCRVLVPFGRGNKRIEGIIIEIAERNPDDNLKEIISLQDDKPILSDEFIKLAKWLKNNTFCMWFDAVKAMLPYGISYKVHETYRLSENFDTSVIANLNAEQTAVVQIFMNSKSETVDAAKIRERLRIENSDVFSSLLKKGVLARCDRPVRNMTDPKIKMVRANTAADENSVKLTPKQAEAYKVLSEIGVCSVKELCYYSGVTPRVIDALCGKGLAAEYENELLRSPVLFEKIERDCREILLTDEQQKAFRNLSAKLKSEKGSAALLYGVTGSGKTQIFLKLCEETLKMGKSAIVMVPEISLTPQMLKIFKSRFGDDVALFHSAMSQGQRMDEWKRAKNGDARIALGTRSAIFAPLKNLGLIIMDEEQEHTYKSEKSPRFHTRNVARFRAAYNNALLLLASATPSLESFSAAQSGRYLLSTLKNRYGNANLPEVVTVDMRRERASGNSGVVSRYLFDEITETLNNGKQAIILLNRRGCSTFVSCPSCGYVMTCPNCSISLTYHSANNRLMCHYCGYSEEYAAACPNCGNKHIKYSGEGTQKAESELNSLFPDARILRMDADSTMARNSFSDRLSDFAEHKYDIMLGTQMVAKGLDFPDVTLVGVIDADHSLNSGDFRSYEKTFSLLTQVVGRSGRGGSKGKAVIQTVDPENNIISLAAKQDYDAFYSNEIAVRKLMTYPPFCDIMMIGVTAVIHDNALRVAKNTVEKIKMLVKEEYSSVKMYVLGPTPAAVPRLNNKYRYKIIIKYVNSSKFRELISKLLNDFSASADSKIASIYADVDPDTII